MNNTIMSGEIVDVYKQILELQSSNHNTAVALLLGMVALGLGFTIIWNIYGAKKYIQSQIQIQFASEKTKILKELEKKIEHDINSEFQKYENNFKKIEAEVYRSMALLSFIYKDYASCVIWWSKALATWIELDSSEQIRIAVDALRQNIDSFPTQKTLRPLKNKGAVIARILLIPKILNKEKNYIKKKIDVLFIEKEEI